VISTNEPLWTLEVPGNLLLFGEYLILEEGGMGLAVGLGGPAICQAFPLHSPKPGLIILEGLQHPGHPGEEWFLDLNVATMQHPEVWEKSMPLLHAAWASISSLVSSMATTAHLPKGIRLKLDTRNFYDFQGRKLGLGSSAAGAVAITAALMRVFDLPGWESPGPVFPLALQTHRLFQKGKGSGYDVAASCYGGLGMFIGGKIPVWEPTLIPWLQAIEIFPGPDPVNTPTSIGSYTAWKSEHPDQAADLKRNNNKHIQELLFADDWEEAEPHAEALRQVGLELGKTLEKTAQIEGPAGSAFQFIKASGAGNEIGFGFPKDPTRGIQPTLRGLTWRRQ
jgi:phosphomevalonate kinase